MRKLSVLLCLFSFMMNNGHSDDLPPEQNQMKPGQVRTPFSAEELKAYNIPGYTTTYRIAVEGKEPIHQVTTWTESASGKASFMSQTVNELGEPVGDPQSAEVDWVELQSHASFPASVTTINTESVEVPAGKFTCWRYDVSRGIPVQDGPPKVLIMTFWFAKDMPGPPVLMTHRVDGELKMTMTLLKAERPENQAAVEE